MRAPLVVALLVALAACGGDSTAPDMTALSGDYVLRTVNGGSLPITVLTTGTVKLEIASETLFVKSNGAFSDVTHYIRTTSGVIDTPADTLSGSWTAKGTVVTFNGGGSNEFIGTVGGAGLTIEGQGLTFRYLK